MRDKSIHIQSEHWLRMDNQLISMDSAPRGIGANHLLDNKSKKRGHEIELWPYTF